MDVILLERIPKLGQMGDTVKVKNGFARNFLLPRGKALRANDANKARFERDKAQLEARNLEARTEAEKVGDKLAGQSFVVIRSAGETGQLYGSVSTRDIAEILTVGGFTVQRSQVRLDRPVKSIGVMEIPIALHPEVEVPITLNVARSEDEARRQAAGEDLTAPDRLAEEVEPEAEETPDVETFFEEGAGMRPEDAEDASEGASDEAAGEDAAQPSEDEEARRG